ncbi:binding-protein-dependent transport systems inner membrane component [Ferroglobus placidus DSM 10642]|uniref:Binding-protein-dependent transport systems inner membrane component n=1 Tax=Ferroglobus placidus (strain DSM 10642 / AEDII12DO) TaxID=589924 RepID=D3S170_FERPA|nr:ABC transporter permease [Ferroglobus placidus]ADC64306.1 binding-protein-dependent transport systems inner membrane component [Ferroglobus placidus DSM 10642]
MRSQSLLYLSLAILFLFYVLPLLFALFKLDLSKIFVEFDEVARAIFLSVTTATFSTFISLFIGVPSAYILSRREFPGKSFVETFLDVPVVIPPVALGTLFLVLFSETQAFSGILFTPYAIIVAQLAVVTAIILRLMKTVFDQIDVSYDYVARSLGYTPAEVFLKVDLPMAKNGIISSAILAWTRAAGEFGATIVLAGASKNVETLPISIYLKLSVADISGALISVFVLVGIGIAAVTAIKRLG